MQPVFSENFLSHYSSDFILSSVTDVRGKTLILKALIEELNSGKIKNAKEEEIKSRFLNQFFGDVLGFNYGNSEHWMLREEKKSAVDATKPDAALGYFSIDKADDKVRAVIEIKNAVTNLDEKQKNHDNRTPVDQAFDYSPKMGGECKWVIVSNIKEIRFYSSTDRSKHQRYFLEELKDENKLKELLFLFHKDRLIKSNEASSTEKLYELAKQIQHEEDKPIHIVDKMYNSIKKFDGFGFVDPNFIAAIFPFNVLNEHVWHYNNHRNLFTLNSEIYILLNEIAIENHEVVFSVALQDELRQSSVFDAKYKIEYVFGFLNNCLIDEITAVKDYKRKIARNQNTLGFSHRHHFHIKQDEDGITKNIKLFKSNTCDCLSCNYRSFDFEKLLSKLKTGIGNEDYNTLEYAFGNYLTASNNFKTSYNIYKSIEKTTKGKQGKTVEYFIAKYNVRLLHNLMHDYEFADKNEIMMDIKSVDLDKIIYDEIEFEVDKDVKKYLIDLKEDVLIYKLQDEIDEIVNDIEKVKLLYENGGSVNSGPNLPYNLQFQYFLLYLHVNRNFIIYDIFKRYKYLTSKVFKGLITCYHIPNFAGIRLNTFFLTEAVVHIYPQDFQEILGSIENLNVEENTISEILGKLTNFTSSYFKKGLFGEPYNNTILSEQLNFFRFKENYTNIFANFFTVLFRLNIFKGQFANCKTSLLNFLKIEEELAWYDLKQFGNFLIRKGDLFEEKELIEILKISIDGDKYGFNKYTELIKQTAIAIHKHYPTAKFTNNNLAKSSILKSSDDDGNLRHCLHLVRLAKICGDTAKQIFYEAFDTVLSKSFNRELYEELMRNTDFDYDKNNYFKLYSEQINLYKGGRAIKYGKSELTDLIFINYVFIIYLRDIDFNRTEVTLFTGLNDFETWLLNPVNFDYNKFEAKWLIDLSNTVIIERIKGIEKIKLAIEIELQREFNAELAKLKYSHFYAVE